MDAQTVIRELTTLDDFQQCVELQKQVWGFDDPYDIVPLPLLLVSQRHEGVVLGGFAGDRMIGFVYSLPGIYHGHKLQWSHMLAVVSEYRNSDIGYRLKMSQYAMSQERGYEYIEWTYDPLESKNAYFNLNKLGCIAKEYEVNIYGETSSPLHMGMPTDRLVAHWPIPPLNKESIDTDRLPEAPALITRCRRDGDALLIEDVNLRASAPLLFVEIPLEIQTLGRQSQKAATDWRMQTRAVFLHYLESGYVVYSFFHWKKTNPNRSFYILKKV
jgi:predicted GNAT superfamily acetyltransferase